MGFTLVALVGAGRARRARPVAPSRRRAGRAWSFGRRLLAALLVGACRSSADGGGTAPPGAAPPAATRTLQIVSGPPAQVTAGASVPLAVRVVDPQGAGVGGVAVAWTVSAGGGTVDPASATSEADGTARTRWRVGTAAGSATVSASLGSGAPLALAAQVVVPVRPTAAFTVRAAAAGEATAFDASGSRASDGGELSYWWDFGDGGRGAAARLARVYAVPGRYPVTLVVRGAAGGADTTRQEVVVAPATMRATSQDGRAWVWVTDEAGAPLPGAVVQAMDGNVRATADAQGIVRLVGLPTGVPVVLASETSDRPAQRRRVLLTPGGAPLALAMRLRRQAVVQELADAARGGLVVASGARLEFPPDGLVDAAGQPARGAVQVQVAPLDVSGDALQAFPGGFAAVRSDGTSGLLLSHGVVDVTLSQGGRPVNLAPGRTAVLDIPITSRGARLQVGDTMPVWSLDERTAVWIEEGVGTIVAASGVPSGLALRARVGHFSKWNADVFVNPGRQPVDAEPCGASAPVAGQMDEFQRFLLNLPIVNFVEINRQLGEVRRNIERQGCQFASVDFEADASGSTIESIARLLSGGRWRDAMQLVVGGQSILLPRGVPVRVRARAYVPQPTISRDAQGRVVGVGVTELGSTERFVPSPPPESGLQGATVTSTPDRPLAPDAELVADTTITLPGSGALRPLVLHWRGLERRNRWLPYDTIQTDIVSATFDYRWQLAGTAGTVIALQVGTEREFRGELEVTLRGPGGASVLAWPVRPSTAPSVLAELPASGTYTLTLASRNASGPVSLRLERAAMMALNSTQRVTLRDDRDERLLAFTLAAPTTVGVALTTPTSADFLALRGSLLDARGAMVRPISSGVPVVLAPGLYAVQLTANRAATGTVALSRIEPPAPITLESPWTDVSGRVDRPADVRAWRFTAAAGERIKVAFLNTDTLSGRLQLHEPGTGSPYARATVSPLSATVLGRMTPTLEVGPHTLARGGEYTLAFLADPGVSGNPRDLEGRFGLRIFRPTYAPLALNTDTTGRLTVQHETAGYRLTVPDDTIVSVAVWHSMLGLPALAVVDPATGRVVADGSVIGRTGPRRLRTGEYLLEFDMDRTESTGPFTIGAAVVAPPRPLALGETVRDSLLRIGDRRYYRLRAPTAGGRAVIRLEALGDLAATAQLRRVGTEFWNGETVGSPATVVRPGVGESFAFTLPEAGDYILEVAPRDEAPRGRYTVRVAAP